MGKLTQQNRRPQSGLSGTFTDLWTGANLLQTTGPVGVVLKDKFFGNSESAEDKSKQKIQDELAYQGYGQFSKMSGFRGNEKKKLEAMKLIQAVIKTGALSVSKLSSYLEKGNITPRTVRRIESALEQKKRQKEMQKQQQGSGNNTSVPSVSVSDPDRFNNQDQQSYQGGQQGDGSGQQGSGGSGTKNTGLQLPDISNVDNKTLVYAGGGLGLVGLGVLLYKAGQGS